ncbi:MAG: alcohol dehydrogenase catalytic domain-containing protein, partial [Candidatus Eremiobacteraeota bacterium]|nr:alcohol dehydrogenase catalytic domain-containing protein [Candidatus Eremiobacteraeota bacterium]
MRQATLEAPKTIVWRDTQTPQPAPGEVIVRVRAALTCGTDLKTYRRGHPKLRFGPFGHEGSGDVAAVGEGVSDFRPGDPVMWTPTAPCGACERCLAGGENLCSHLTDDMALGAYADFLRLPARVVARNLFPKPADLHYVEAAFLEPLSCVVHGWEVLRNAKPARSSPTAVAIIGAGSIGLLHLGYARHAGVTATVIAHDQRRMQIAADMGSQAVFSATEPALEAAFPAVIDCGGTVQSWRDAIALTAPGGRTLLFSGLPDRAEVTLDATRVHYDELTLLGSFHFTPADVRAARTLLVEGALQLQPLISDVLAL